jgi:hypothetical protein
MLTYAALSRAVCQNGTQAAGLWLQQSRKREQALQESHHRFQTSREADRVAQVVYITRLLVQLVYITRLLVQPPQATASRR